MALRRKRSGRHDRPAPRTISRKACHATWRLIEDVSLLIGPIPAGQNVGPSYKFRPPAIYQGRDRRGGCRTMSRFPRRLRARITPGGVVPGGGNVRRCTDAAGVGQAGCAPAGGLRVRPRPPGRLTGGRPAAAGTGVNRDFDRCEVRATTPGQRSTERHQRPGRLYASSSRKPHVNLVGFQGGSLEHQPRTLRADAHGATSRPAAARQVRQGATTTRRPRR